MYLRFFLTVPKSRWMISMTSRCHRINLAVFDASWYKKTTTRVWIAPHYKLLTLLSLLFLLLLLKLLKLLTLLALLSCLSDKIDIVGIKCCSCLLFAKACALWYQVIYFAMKYRDHKLVSDPAILRENKQMLARPLTGFLLSWRIGASKKFVVKGCNCKIANKSEMKGVILRSIIHTRFIYWPKSSSPFLIAFLKRINLVIDKLMNWKRVHRCIENFYRHWR